MTLPAHSDERTTFHVHVDRKSGGYEVSVILVDAGGTRQDFATVDARLLDVALRMAVPYMACAAEPDPFASLLEASRVAAR